MGVFATEGIGGSETDEKRTPNPAFAANRATSAPTGISILAALPRRHQSTITRTSAVGGKTAPIAVTKPGVQMRTGPSTRGVQAAQSR
jgi:hypothetical protein